MEPETAIPNPTGLCMCGCGQTTPISKLTRPDGSAVKGEHTRYIHGHHNCRVPFGTPAYVVDPITGCWLWERGTYGDGYGCIRTPEGRHMGAHRYFYEQVNGPVPEGMELDHLCCTPLCVNPAHLEPTTHQENCKRGWASKRQLKVA
jgi:hypothetical protein